MVNFGKWIGWFINSWEIGQGKVFGRVNGAVNFALLLSTWLLVVGFNIPTYFILFFIVLMGLFFVVSGFLYERLGFYRIEINRYNSINPFQRQVLERLEKIEAKLK
jgi:hypothetical protein